MGDMEIRYLRVMEADDWGKPMIGRGATLLGVRIGGEYVDIPVDEDNRVHPKTGGM